MNLKYAIIIIVIVLGTGFILPSVKADGCCIVGGLCLDIPSGQSCSGITLSNTLNCGAIPNYANQCNDQCCCMGNTGPGQQDIPLHCTTYGGKVIYNINPSVCSGNTYCQGVVNTYNISGTIINASNNAKLVATVSTGYSDTLSDTKGLYKLLNVQENSLVTLSANTTDCHGTLSINNFNSNLVNQDITLTCCALNCPDWSTVPCVNNLQTRTCTNTCDNSPVVQQQGCNFIPACDWNCTWTDCTGGATQSTSTCKKTPADANGNWVGCTGNPARPPFTQLCPGQGNCNHDGIVQSPEQCDYNYTSKVFDGSGCQAQAPFDTLLDCDVGTCQCKPHTINPNNDCAADPGTVSIFTASSMDQKKAFSLTWALDKGGTDACADYVDHFDIRRCTNNTGQCFFNLVINNSINKNDRTLIDNLSITQNFKYCYLLNVTFNKTTGFAHRTAVACVTAGDDACMQPHPKNWCGVTSTYPKATPLDCTSPDNNVEVIQGNPPPPPCTGSQYCTYDSNGDAICQDQGPCDECNSVLGLFGMSGNTVLNPATGDIDFSCPSLANPAQSGCFIDYTKTAVDQSFNCSKVQSCYDYSSRGACEQDFCNQFTQSGGCVWNPYNIEFSKGECVPKDQALDNCSLCNDPMHNRFYPDCTADTCALYGNCYFNNQNKCVNDNGVFCRTYNTKDDCVGIPPNDRSVIVDVQWNSTAMISGSNLVQTKSNDATGIGTCRWTTIKGVQQCIKDADYNNTDDCTTVRGKPEMNHCERDNQAPNTIITNRQTYGMTIDLTSTLNIIDNYPWPLGDDSLPILRNVRNTTWLYYCVAPSTGTCYPTKVLGMTPTSPDPYKIKMSDFKNKDGNYVTDTNSNGYGFSLFYFAEDPAKNLEQVKSFSFTLDSVPPDVVLQRDYATWQDGAIYRTNLTLTIILNAESSLPATCTLKLRASASFDTDIAAAFNSVLPYYDIPSQAYPQNIITKTNGKFNTLNTTYPNLVDGNYDYALQCTDDVGNTQSQTGTIHVEGDIRINNAYPSGQIFRLAQVPTTMHINTIGDGICKYSDSTTNYNLMSGTFAKTFVTANNYSFSANLAPLLKNPPSTIYRFYVACNLIINGQPQLVTGDAGDTIYFSVDELPPLTSPMSVDLSTSELTPYTPDPTNTVTFLKLNLACLDNASTLVDQYILPDGNLYYHDMSFGCNSTYYCLRRLSNPSGCDNSASYTQSTDNIVLDYTAMDSPDRIKYGNSPTLCYYSKDNGGNIEGMHTIGTGYGITTAYGVCIRLNLRNPFLTPDINITNGPLV